MTVSITFWIIFAPCRVPRDLMKAGVLKYYSKIIPISNINNIFVLNIKFKIGKKQK